METLFLDAGSLIALEAEDDQYHSPALQYWNEFSLAPPSLITTTFVFDEVVTFFNNRNNHTKAVEIGDDLLGSNVIEMVEVDEALLLRGWKYFRDHSDKRYSLTDCISFVVMSERDITRALTFDRHFAQAGFEKIPKPARSSQSG